MGACNFITCLDEKPIGVGSFDPRGKPEKGLIGWNCIVPEYQGKGYGKAQIEKTLGAFREIGIKKALVNTCDEEFYVPAQMKYEACGFKVIRKTDGNIIEYELHL